MMMIGCDTPQENSSKTLLQNINQELEDEQAEHLTTSQSKEYSPTHIIKDISNLSLHCDWQTPKTVQQWRIDLKAEWVTNAGYFDEEFKPTGFVKTKNDEWGDFYNYPVFIGQDSLNQITINSPEGFSPNDFTWALTSYPQLVKNSKTGFPTETNKRANRTIIAQKKDRTDLVLFFDYPTLYQSAERLLSSGYDNAINLDGGPSAGLASEEFSYPSSRVGCVISSTNHS